MFKGDMTNMFSVDDMLTRFQLQGNGHEAIVSVGKELSTRVQSLLKSVQVGFNCPSVMFQFWAPIKTKTGETVLMVSEQQFGLGNGIMSSGLCRYRYHCIRCEYEDKDGPPARVFKRGLREDCENIMRYSIKEFPSRNYAIKCGIVSYFAVPLVDFYDASTPQCVGVLECFSTESYDFYRHEYPVECAAKELGLEFHSPHYHKCDKIRRDMFSPRVEIKRVLKAVREAQQLPLVQLWVPCMCDDDQTLSSDDKLFCDMRICGENLECLSEFEHFRAKRGTFFVKSGEGLVGRAYSQNIPCFSSDTSQLSLWDSPFAHFTRSAGLAACFVIPLESVHPMLDALFLEIFLPTQGIGNSEAVLKSLLLTVAKEFSKLNVVVGLTQDEEFQVTMSHRDCEKFDYFHIHRRCNVNVENSLPDYHHEPNAQEVTTAMADDNFSLDVMKQQNYQQDIADSSREVIATRDTTDDTSRDVVATMDGDRITLEVLKPYFGNVIDAAAEGLGVSRSTLKRRCRALGIKRWPWHKRNKVKHIQSEKVAPHSQFQTKNNSADSNSMPLGTKNNSADREAAADSVLNGDRLRQSYDMIGKATYGDDTVMFPLKSNAGIKELHKQLNQRFQLQADKFKIKYKHEEDWILVICDQDLHLGLEMIKSTGENTINLSIFPLSTS